MKERTPSLLSLLCSLARHQVLSNEPCFHVLSVNLEYPDTEYMFMAYKYSTYQTIAIYLVKNKN